MVREDIKRTSLYSKRYFIQIKSYRKLLKSSIVRYRDSVTRITLIISHFLNLNTIPITGLILWLAAVSLFLIGHRIEGNFRTMTLSSI